MSAMATIQTPVTESVLGHNLIHALAASPAFADDGLCFAAHASGLARSEDGGRMWCDAYATLNLQTVLTTAAVVLSPDFASDRTLFAGASGGVLRSLDAGEHWLVAALPSPPPFVTALAVSPNYATDGLVFAGTMEDGVLRSWDRGASWAAWNFGLLDLNVYALAISPDFAHDDTLYVGAESGVFCSTNGGRAWRETIFPMECAPVLSLALSPAFGVDGCILAGSAAHGLWRSADRGGTWQRMPGLDTVGAINGLLMQPTETLRQSLLALTGAGPYESQDGGVNWRKLAMAEECGLTCAVAPTGLAAGALVLLGCDDGRVLTVRMS
jgi:photosystem II stability/assembly factor-like uncharacterized protein